MSDSSFQPMIVESKVYDLVKPRWQGPQRLAMYYLVDFAAYFVLLVAMFTILKLMGVLRVEAPVWQLLPLAAVFALALALMVGTFTWMVWFRKWERDEREAAAKKQAKKARKLTHKTYH